MFQHAAARRRLAQIPKRSSVFPCFNTQPPEDGWLQNNLALKLLFCFNTQPPEDGWDLTIWYKGTNYWFQHTAARRRLVCACTLTGMDCTWFQHTAARRRLGHSLTSSPALKPSFNTQPPEDGWDCGQLRVWRFLVSTHSRPKTAGRPTSFLAGRRSVSTHSRPKTAGFDLRA